mmetsp:Transcript_6296/g.14336  ORF Transcript_6296/g.14336 Transcript_6296/m.14336 type:complete len:743 (+) Transcript_6296:85-2313(+)
MENLMQRFPDKKYDVTNYVESCCMLCFCPCCGWQTKTLNLQSEEVLYKTRNLCSSSTQKRPYAQLGSVELHDSCCGMCVAMSSNLEKCNEKGEGGIRPFFGVDRPYTEELCNELRARMEGRGDTAQRKQQTFLLDQVTKLTAELPLIMQKRGVQWPPPAATAQKLFGSDTGDLKTFAQLYNPEEEPKFDTKMWDVVCCCELLNCTSRTIELGPDEAVIRITRGLDRASVTERRPYAQIDDVKKEKGCGCFSQMTAGELIEQPLANGAGCDDATISEIVDELKRRIEIRGNIGQMKKLESIMKKVDDLRMLMQMMQHELGVDTQYPPSDMSKLPAIRPHAAPSEQFPTRKFDVTNYCGALFCCFTLKTEMTLENDKVITDSSSCIGADQTSQPYAQISSVDEARGCYCCRSVNGIVPGCGCQGQKVTDLANELQQRKVKRGDIAQLRNQENTMLNALELSVRTGSVVKKLGVQYPPSQETLMADYGPGFTLPKESDGYLGEEVHVGPSQQHGEKDFDVTNYIESCCICFWTLGLAGCQTQHLHLGDEEVTLTKKDCCSTSTMRMPYAQLGSVDAEMTCCGNCFNVETAGGTIQPKCGCDKGLVDQISDDLQHRKVTRGNIAQVRMQENLMIEVIKLGVQLDLIAKKEGIEYPPSQETMTQVFGPNARVPQKMVAPVVAQGADPSMMQVIIPEGVGPGQQFQVQGPGGGMLQVQVPQGALPGQVVSVAAPVVVGAPVQASMKPV